MKNVDFPLRSSPGHQSGMPSQASLSLLRHKGKLENLAGQSFSQLRLSFHPQFHITGKSNNQHGWLGCEADLDGAKRRFVGSRRARLSGQVHSCRGLRWA
ncbi:MAG: hypothetical protein KatS3mg110_2814 [Pirellulaceae bacterium]|nr:MAG: hypothetical protein KatS3mg110_2814 [Pirellulaceae bacterium]